MRKQDLRRIVKEDNARRAARRVIEDAILGIGIVQQDDVTSDAYKIAHNTVKGAWVNPCLVRGIGTVNPPVHTSASDNCWNRGMRGKTKGIAPGTADTSDGTPTMRIIKPGLADVIVPANGYGRTRKVGKAHAPIKMTRYADGRVVEDTVNHSTKVIDQSKVD
jgi:hypothetical protein